MGGFFVVVFWGGFAILCHMNIQPQQLIKSADRVRNHGEVFTPDWLVNDMLDLVEDQCERIDSRFLEPACGHGNFLEKIIRRKLITVKYRYKKSEYDFAYNSFLAYACTYGIDIQADNVTQCRERLLNIFIKLYKKSFPNDWEQKYINCIQFVLSKNIVCGNALDLLDNAKNPIVFSEWKTESEPYYITQKNYEMADLMAYSPMTETDSQMSFLNDMDERVLVPKVVGAYKPIIFYNVENAEKDIAKAKKIG